MIDAIQEIDAYEPRPAAAPAPATPAASVILWAGMFAMVYAAASSMIALMYVRR